jgi:hypothetical protein
MGRFPVKESHQPWQGKHKRENGILISINFGHTLSAPKAVDLHRLPDGSAAASWRAT